MPKIAEIARVSAGNERDGSVVALHFGGGSDELIVTFVDDFSLAIPLTPDKQTVPRRVERSYAR